MYKKVTCVALLIVTQLAFSLELSDIQTLLSRSHAPDTCDYRTKTTIQINGQMLSSIGHTIQSDPDHQWMEHVIGSKTLRIVRNGNRMKSIDVGNGGGAVVPVEESNQASLQMQSILSKGRWTKPISIGNGLWQAIDTLPQDASVYQQKINFSESLNQIVMLAKINKNMDTTTSTIGWGVESGKQVPMRIEVQVKSAKSSITTLTEFSQWIFPRSLPASLFVIH